MKKIILAAASFSLLAFAEQTRVVFFDDFSSNANNWQLGGTHEFATAMKDGKLILESNSEAGRFFWKEIKIDTTLAFTVSTSITQQGGVENYGYGIVWGAKDGSNAYCFVAASNGTFSVYKYQNGKYYDIIPWQKSKAINFFGSPNEFKIIHSKKEIQYFINDSLAGSTPYNKPFGNFTGFVIDHHMLLEADYLKMEEVK